MTDTPTQAQIEAALVAAKKVRLGAGDDYAQMIAALTAAAQVGGGLGSFPEDDPRPGAFHAAQIEALKSALEPFAKIEVPAEADDGTWVAKTLFCNDQVTAHSVRKAKAAITAAARIGEPKPAKDFANSMLQFSTLSIKEVEAATIERCAQVAYMQGGMEAQMIAEKIRDLRNKT